jgi:hypothetical protein
MSDGEGGVGVEVSLNVNELINQAASAWTAIVADSAMEAHLCQDGEAIPKDQQFQQLSGWDEVKHESLAGRLGLPDGVFQIPHRAKWIGEPTKFDIVCSYRANGHYHGKGKFLQNVDYLLKVSNVAWLCSAVVSGRFDNPPANIGSPEDPLAELVSHIVIQPKHADWAWHVQVVIRGDGTFQVTEE